MKGQTVLIVDDNAPTRAWIAAALRDDGFDLVGEGATADAAIELALAHRPDIALLDIHMPGSGIAATATINRQAPEVSVVMLTYSRDDDDLFDSLRAGARGYLVKDMDPGRLGAALRGVLGGEAAIPRELAARVLDQFRSAPRRKVFSRGKRPVDLTSREWEVMEMLQQGLSTTEVASRLFVSPGTVRVHVSSVLRKLQADDRSAALRMMWGRRATDGTRRDG